MVHLPHLPVRVPSSYHGAWTPQTFGEGGREGGRESVSGESLEDERPACDNVASVCAAAEGLRGGKEGGREGRHDRCKMKLRELRDKARNDNL